MYIFVFSTSNCYLFLLHFELHVEIILELIFDIVLRSIFEPHFGAQSYHGGGREPEDNESCPPIYVYMCLYL